MSPLKHINHLYEKKCVSYSQKGIAAQKSQTISFLYICFQADLYYICTDLY